MLQRNPSKRLGSGKIDAEEIKNHPIFADLDWDMVLDRYFFLSMKYKIKIGSWYCLNRTRLV